MRLTHSLFLGPFAAILIACGGGGGDANPAPPSPGATSPPTSSGVTGGTDGRSKALAAVSAAAASAPAAGTAGTLPVVSAGEIQIDGGAQYITFTKTLDGKYYGLSDALGTYLVDPTDVVQVCVNSSQIGWNVPGYTSRSCSPLDTNGFAVLPRTCNKDLVAYNMDTKSGKKLWLDHVSERKFVRKGIISTVQPNGLIAYGSYVPATVSLKAGTAAGTADLTYNWQNNCMGGFGKDGLLTDLNPNLAPDDPDFRYISFLWNSNKEGWGLRASGDRVPSTKQAFASFDAATGNYSVTFTGLKCNDKGNVTAYKGTGLATAVVWDFGTDDFGAGWGIIQAASDPFQFWSIQTNLPTGVNLFFDRLTYQLGWNISGCNT